MSRLLLSGHMFLSLVTVVCCITHQFSSDIQSETYAAHDISDMCACCLRANLLI